MNQSRMFSTQVTNSKKTNKKEDSEIFPGLFMYI